MDDLDSQRAASSPHPFRGLMVGGSQDTCLPDNFYLKTHRVRHELMHFERRPRPAQPHRRASELSFRRCSEWHTATGAHGTRVMLGPVAIVLTGTPTHCIFSIPRMLWTRSRSRFSCPEATRLAVEGNLQNGPRRLRTMSGRLWDDKLTERDLLHGARFRDSAHSWRETEESRQNECLSSPNGLIAHSTNDVDGGARCQSRGFVFFTLQDQQLP